MAAAADEVSTKLLVDTKRPPRLARRRTWPEALKRQIVDETLEPGGIGFDRGAATRCERQPTVPVGRELLPKEPSEVESGQMVPVEIVPVPERRERRRRAEPSGFIEIGAR